MLDFKPPKDNRRLIWLVKALLPAVLRYDLNNTQVEVVKDGVRRLKELKGKRCVICPNHPCQDDPQIMFAFAKKVGEDFNYLAAREVFDWNGGLRGWFFQRLGCYSVVRGGVDRESFKTTKRLISEGRKKLVIFPEGEISRQNDTLMPLESGVVQLSFWAIEEMRKAGNHDPVFLLPVALKYTYRANITQSLSRSLKRLEVRLDISVDENASLYSRLRMVAEDILSTLEKEYNFKPASGSSLNERIYSLRAYILKGIASYLRIDLTASATPLEWIRTLRNALDDFIYNDGKALCEYEKRIHEERAENIKGFYRQLDRVVNFISIYDGYIKDRMTQERFADVLNRFEVEVFGDSTSYGPRVVLIDVGEPINLVEKFSEYKQNKRVAVHSINDELAKQISTMLYELDKNRLPIFVE